MSYDLIMFDVDGTLADRDTGVLLPGRRLYFVKLAALHPLGEVQLALVSNQGGVACGLKGWGETYPTREEAEAHVVNVAMQIGPIYQFPAIYISFNFQDKAGNWLFPDDFMDIRWSHAWRKPAPGMLLQAMADAGVVPAAALMVGDRAEDRLAAAAAAGCAFAWAETFFS